MLKRAAQLLVRKLVTRPMGLRAKSSANNFGTSNGRPQVPNDDVNDRCEGGADEEEGWPELLLALAAVPLALVGCACRVFGRFAVSISFSLMLCVCAWLQTFLFPRLNETNTL